MDGYIAKLPEICDLADKYNAMVMVDDSHAVGFMGKTGRGTHEHHNVMGRIDIITGTLGKALGGASGGYTSGRKEIIRSTAPTLASLSCFLTRSHPPSSAASLKVLDLLTECLRFCATVYSPTPPSSARRWLETGFQIPAR